MDKPNSIKRISQLGVAYQRKLMEAAEGYARKENTWKYLEVAMTLFVVVFFLIFAVRPAVTTISGLVGEIKDKEAVSLKMKKKINSIIAAQEEYSMVQGRILAIDDCLPAQPAVADGIAQLFGLGQTASLTLSGVNVSGFVLDEQGYREDIRQDNKESLKGDEFGISFRGDYQNLRDLLTSLSSVRRWLGINSYQISSPDKKKDEGSLLNLSLNGVFYYFSSGFRNSVNEE
ncbi:MAG: hypothetical protein ABID04_01930 [Patescibacteria group bacterium]